jgi:hypothetical protein
MNTFSFDKALDSLIDGIEQSVVDRARAAASDLLAEEYKAPVPIAPAASAVADFSKINDVAGFWRLFDLQVDSQKYSTDVSALPVKPWPKYIICKRAHKSQSSLNTIC